MAFVPALLKASFASLRTGSNSAQLAAEYVSFSDSYFVMSACSWSIFAWSAFLSSNAKAVTNAFSFSAAAIAAIFSLPMTAFMSVSAACTSAQLSAV